MASTESPSADTAELLAAAGAALGRGAWVEARELYTHAYFHTEAARLFGATEDEINETALIAKNTMGWSTYLNTLQFDYDAFTEEFDQMTAHVREQMAGGAPA